jgi:hypothetical protein
MDSIKAFFAKDAVKIVAAGLYFIANGLIITVMPDSPTKQTVLMVWNGVITPLCITLGIISGGTSSLRSNASQAQTAVLVEKGVVPPKV